MTGCSAYGCTNREGDEKGLDNISFHKFPLDEPRRTQWTIAVRRKNWTPSRHSVLCSAHFEDKMVDRSMRRKVLTKTAVPTIFSFSEDLQKNQKKRPIVISFDKNWKNGTSESEEMPTCIAETSYNRKSEEVEEMSAFSAETSCNRNLDEDEEVSTCSDETSYNRNLNEDEEVSTCSDETSYNRKLEENEQMCTSSAETSYKRKFEEAEKKLNDSRKKIKALQATTRRQKKRIQYLEQLVSTLKEQRNDEDEEQEEIEVFIETAEHTR